MLRLPDFLIAGAPRSGTTFLSAALDRHPDVWIARPAVPEPKFFLVDELYALGLEEYSLRWFEVAPEGALLGEKSTNYLESATAAARVARDLPDVKLLFMLRDPVERAASNYRWSVMHGLEDQDFGAALDLEEQREAELAPQLRYARPHAYFSRGCYAALLRPWLERFPREHVLCLRFEDLVARGEPTLTRTQRFLGLPERGDLVPAVESVNPSAPTADIDPDVLRRLRLAYEEPNRDLAGLLGPAFQVWDETAGVP